MIINVITGKWKEDKFLKNISFEYLVNLVIFIIYIIITSIKKISKTYWKLIYQKIV